MRALLILSLLLVSCSGRVAENNKNGSSSVPQDRKSFQVIVPHEMWERIYFEAIEERAKVARLPSLRLAALPEGDLEARIWIGFGLTGLRGYILRRSAGEWTGTYLRSIDPLPAGGDYQEALQEPKSGWGGCWQRLVNRGLLVLPDAVSIGCKGGAYDGVSYVVEINMDETYRTYLYDNPQFAGCVEAGQMIELVEILHDEFPVNHLIIETKANQ